MARYMKPLKFWTLLAIAGIASAYAGRQFYEFNNKFTMAYRMVTEKLDSCNQLPVQIPEDGPDVKISDCAAAEGITSSAEMAAYTNFVQENMFAPGKVVIRNANNEGNEFIRVRTTDQNGHEDYRNVEIPFRRTGYLPKDIKLSLPDWNEDGSVGGDDYKSLSVRQRKDKDRSTQATMRNQMKVR